MLPASFPEWMWTSADTSGCTTGKQLNLGEFGQWACGEGYSMNDVQALASYLRLECLPNLLNRLFRFRYV